MASLETRRATAKGRAVGGPSAYRGVIWHKSNGKWEARIYEAGKQRFLGYFLEEVAAAEAYDARAVHLHGQNAKVNFPQNHRETFNNPPACKLMPRKLAPKTSHDGNKRPVVRRKRVRWESEESEDLDLSDEDYSPFADCGNRAEEPMMRTRSETADGSDQTRQETEAIEALATLRQSSRELSNQRPQGEPAIKRSGLASGQQRRLSEALTESTCTSPAPRKLNRSLDPTQTSWKIGQPSELLRVDSCPLSPFEQPSRAEKVRRHDSLGPAWEIPCNEWRRPNGEGLQRAQQMPESLPTFVEGRRPEQKLARTVSQQSLGQRSAPQSFCRIPSSTCLLPDKHSEFPSLSQPQNQCLPPQQQMLPMHTSMHRCFSQQVPSSATMQLQNVPQLMPPNIPRLDRHGSQQVQPLQRPAAMRCIPLQKGMSMPLPSQQMAFPQGQFCIPNHGLIRKRSQPVPHQMSHFNDQYTGTRCESAMQYVATPEKFPAMKGPETPATANKSAMEKIFQSACSVAGPNQEGIYFDGSVGKWQASIKLEDSLVDLGAYATCMEAAIAFTTAAQILQLASTARVQGATLACHHSQSCNAKPEGPTIGSKSEACLVAQQKPSGCKRPNFYSGAVPKRLKVF